MLPSRLKCSSPSGLGGVHQHLAQREEREKGGSEGVERTWNHFTAKKALSKSKGVFALER